MFFFSFAFLRGGVAKSKALSRMAAAPGQAQSGLAKMPVSDFVEKLNADYRLGLSQPQIQVWSIHGVYDC